MGQSTIDLPICNQKPVGRPISLIISRSERLILNLKDQPVDRFWPFDQPTSSLDEFPAFPIDSIFKRFDILIIFEMGNLDNLWILKSLPLKLIINATIFDLT